MHSNDFPDCFYRVSVKGLFFKDDKVLLIKEPVELSGQFELPGGGLDFGEDPHIGLKREIEEELGLNVTSISKYPVYVWPARFEGWTNMDWYYSMVLAYRIELESLDLPHPLNVRRYKCVLKMSLIYLIRSHTSQLCCGVKEHCIHQ